MAELDGKVAVVTGASKGIGAQIAKQLAVAGAAVVVNYSSSKAGADKVVGQIREASGRAVAVQADLSNAEQIAPLFDAAVKEFGHLDILVNNAGVYEFASLGELTPEHYHRQFNLNVLGLLLASQQAAKRFGDRGGVIINISSVVARLAMPGASVYGATKAAVNSITTSLAAELGPNVRVNSINPGMVETEGTHSQGIIESDMRKQVETTVPLRRIGQPQDLAPLAVFLASDASSWITGENFYVSGGHR